MAWLCAGGDAKSVELSKAMQVRCVCRCWGAGAAQGRWPTGHACPLMQEGTWSWARSCLRMRLHVYGAACLLCPQQKTSRQLMLANLSRTERLATLCLGCVSIPTLVVVRDQVR